MRKKIQSEFISGINCVKDLRGGKPPWTALLGADRYPRRCWEQKKICYKVLGSLHQLRRWERAQWLDIWYTSTCTYELLEITSLRITTLVSRGNCWSNLKLNLPICDWAKKKLRESHDCGFTECGAMELPPNLHAHRSYCRRLMMPGL